MFDDLDTGVFKIAVNGQYVFLNGLLTYTLLKAGAIESSVLYYPKLNVINSCIHYISYSVDTKDLLIASMLIVFVNC